MTTIKPPTFYRIDSAAVSLREYWWGSPASVPLAALLKVLHVRIPGSSDDPNVETLAPFEREESAVPADVWRRCEPLLRELQEAGFHSPIHYFIEDDLHNGRTYLATLMHESGLAWARVHDRVWAIRTPPKEVLFTECVTEFNDRRFVWSLTSKPDLAAPPNCTLARRAGARPTELWALHRARVEQEGARRRVVPLRTGADLRASVERHHAAIRNFHLRRGVFVPMTRDDRRLAAANAQIRQAATGGGSQYPDVLAEIRRLQEQKANWTTAALVLLVSLALFFGVGTSGGMSGVSFESLLILVPVLFFHEAGHWIAMRFFGYRNLQMFFIPFLGAAVSGRHYNVPGWKKAVVSLMGPVPGIVVGALLGAGGLVLQEPLLLRVALTALVLNGFNLLPILPLDGGWVVQAMLASRSVAFDVIFRGLAVLALVAGGLTSGDKVLTLLGIVMLVGLPAAYKLARVTRELRKSGLESTSPDDQTIPAATAEAIITKVREAFPSRAPTKQIALHTLHVFESFNARPPGVLASLGLAFTQGASLLGALVFAGLIVVGQQASLGGLMRAAQTLPTYRLDPATIMVWRAPGGPEVTVAPHNVVVATFGRVADAHSAYAETQQRAPARSAAEVLGQTVLLALPADDDTARQSWLAAFQSKAAEAFVATPKTPAMVRVSCLAGSSETAVTIEQEMSDYFLASHLHLIPPWIEPDTRTAAERAAHAHARRTYARVAMWAADVFADERLSALAARTQAAQRAGDTAELARLPDERRRLLADLRRARIERISAEAGIDLVVIERYRALAGHADPPDAALLSADIGPRLGQLPLVDEAPEAASQGLSATGFVGREGLLLNLPGLRFGSTFEGPPALLRWLGAKGCTDLRYQFEVGYEEGIGEDDEES